MPGSAQTHPAAAPPSRLTRSASTGALAVVIALFALKCASVALTGVFSFDGAVNAQVAHNLVADRQYRTQYQSGRDGAPPFATIQTGPPVVLPVAAAFRLFGESFASGLMVNALYLVALFLAVAWYLKTRARASDTCVAAALLLLGATPGLFDIGFGLYGEMPMLFYLMLTLILLDPEAGPPGAGRVFLAGLAFGAGYLTKTVILIALPALALLALGDALAGGVRFAAERSRARGALRRAAAFAAGALAPAGLFEAFKLGSLGTGGYLAWWGAMQGAILKQAGVRKGYADTPGLHRKFLAHLEILAAATGLPLPVLAALLALLLLSATVAALSLANRLSGRRAADGTAGLALSGSGLVLVLVSVSYFGWWLLISTTQKAWYRRVIPGVLLAEIWLAVVVALLLERKAAYASRFAPRVAAALRNHSASLAAAAPVALVAAAIASAASTVSFVPSQARGRLTAAGAVIERLPAEAVVYGFGWWQAPSVAFASKRAFRNLEADRSVENPGPLRERYLVVDKAARGLAAGEIRRTLDQFTHEPVLENAEAAVYRLLTVKPLSYPPFTTAEREATTAGAIDFSGDGTGVAQRNIHFAEANASGKWARRLSGFLLRRRGEPAVRIVFSSAPPQDYGQAAVRVVVSVDGRAALEYVADRAGTHEIVVPLGAAAGPVVELSLLASARLDARNDARELALFLLAAGMSR